MSWRALNQNTRELVDSYLERMYDWQSMKLCRGDLRQQKQRTSDLNQIEHFLKFEQINNTIQIHTFVCVCVCCLYRHVYLRLFLLLIHFP